ncbi:MATE family efflux transporter [Patescibacteria group bacterium]|nr:MATE family efflux transporter [Patescibacteria group bacterium]
MNFNFLKTSKRNLTEGSMLKALIALAVPVVFANLLQTAYQLIDTFWVGRIGGDAVASVTLAFPIIFLMIALGGGLAAAGAILVAQYKGKRDYKMIDFVAGQAFSMTLFNSVIITVAGYFAAQPLLELMGAEGAVLVGATQYLEISFLGTVFMYGFLVFQWLMNGVGDVVRPMLIVLSTVLLNLILDPLFIFGYGSFEGMGVSGAALATVITQAVAAIIGFVLLFKRTYGVRLVVSMMKPDFKYIAKMFKLGIPASMEQAMRAFGFAVLAFLVASFSSDVIAAYGIGIRILSFIIIPTLGLAMATSTLVGQNIGAGKPERAQYTVKLAAMISFFLLTGLGVFAFFFSYDLVAMFVPSELSVIAMGGQMIRIMALSFGFIGLQHVINGAFRGAGKTLTSMIISLIAFWVLTLPLAYILSKHTDMAEVGIWWAFPIANVIASILAVIWFIFGDWKKKSILE